MKKYNKPEIVTLALDAVDVIETSAVTATVSQALENAGTTGGYTSVSIQDSITEMNDKWNW